MRETFTQAWSWPERWKYFAPGRLLHPLRLNNLNELICLSQEIILLNSAEVNITGNKCSARKM